MKGIIGKKLGMTQIFNDNGQVVPVTIIQAGPCPVVQRKTNQTDGYEAVQLGFGDIKPSRVNKPRAGHFKKQGVPAARFLKEIRVEESTPVSSGHVITVDVFNPGEKVKITGTSKGRGFSGVIKRHGFHGTKATHGTHEYFRHGGSIGSAAYPARVFKGVKMPGQYGNKQFTSGQLEIVEVRSDDNLLLIKGAVPGPAGGMVVIRAIGDFPAPAEPEDQQIEQVDDSVEETAEETTESSEE